jgi:hypothetical protein
MGGFSKAKANGIKTACRRIAEDLLPAEAADVRNIDVDVVTERYKNRKCPAPKTLAEYRGRIKSVVSSFVEHVDGPPDGKPDDTHYSSEVEPDCSKSERSKTGGGMKSNPYPAKPSQPSNNLQVMIRPDFLVQVILPYDLSPAEAKHIARLIEAIPMERE